MAANKEEVEIIFDDVEMLVLNKPAGWVTTREQIPLGFAASPFDKGEIKNVVKYVEDWVEKYYPNTLPRRGIVHRLDKGTSGILVVAKTQGGLDNLKKQFKQRQVEKHYLALASGNLPIDGQVNMPINRSKYGFGKFKVDEEGKMAVTEFKLVKKIDIAGKVFSLLNINLKTGRTHQIRVHLNYLGWPVAGDRMYGGAAVAGLTRPFLHAYELRIKHPKTGKILTFKADLPPDLEEILN